MVSVFNINSFENDKVAYVFSSMMDSAETALSLLENEVSAQKTNFEILISAFDFSRNIFPQEAKSLLQFNQSVNFVEVSGINNTEVSHLDSLGKAIDGMPKFKKVKEADIKTEGLMTPFLIPGNENLWGLNYTFAIKGYTFPLYQITVVYKKNPIQDLLDKPRYFNLFTINDSGHIMASAKSFKDDHIKLALEKNLHNTFAENAKNKTSATSLTKIVNEFSKNELLIAVTKSPTLPWGFLAVIEKSKTMNAIQQMKQNSVGIFLILIGIGLILTVLLVRALIKNIEILSDSMIHFSKGELKTKVSIHSSDEIGKLSNIFNDMTEKIEQLVIDNTEKSRMSGELETARVVQESMVPRANITQKDFEVIGHFEPASETGGDWWFYSVTESQISLYIADVTGHGVASALMTSALRAAVETLQNTSQMNISEYVSCLNQVIYQSGNEKLMMTFFMCQLERNTGVLNYVNASHCAPVILRSNKEDSKDVDMIFLDGVGGPRLGERTNSKYKSHQVTLLPNDILFAYTDGLTEFENESRRAFGEKKTYKNIKNSIRKKKATLAIKNILIKEFLQFRGGLPLDDDLTLFFLKYFGKPTIVDNLEVSEEDLFIKNLESGFQKDAG